MYPFKCPPSPRVLAAKENLDPNFVTGFTDAESCFFIQVSKDKNYQTGSKIQLFFLIALHKKDLALLEMIRAALGRVGNITKRTKDTIQYRVVSLKDLAVIIAHFDKYPLITQKQADFILFKQAFEMVKSKEHLTIEGIHKLVAIKASMNSGLSDDLKAAFPNISPVQRPLVLDKKIKDPNWLAGFATGEGCFLVVLAISSYCKVGERVLLNFQITQHARDEALLQSLKEYLGCGNYYPIASRDAGEFRVNVTADIINKIIPFFDKYPIEGVKALDYLDFKRAAKIIQMKGHLTNEGLEEIRKIRLGMNTGRSN